MEPLAVVVHGDTVCAVDLLTTAAALGYLTPPVKLQTLLAEDSRRLHDWR